MARTEEKVGKWAIRYQCHCGKVYRDYFPSMSGVSVCDGDDPGSEHVCEDCGCVGSYKASKGRYKWTVTYRFFGNKESESVWETWVRCPHV